MNRSKGPEPASTSHLVAPRSTITRGRAESVPLPGGPLAAADLVNLQRIAGNGTASRLLRRVKGQSSKIVQRGLLEELNQTRASLVKTDSTADLTQVADHVRAGISGEDEPAYLRMLASKSNEDLIDWLRKHWAVVVGSSSFTGDERNLGYARQVIANLRKREIADLLDLVSLEHGGRDFSSDPDEIAEFMTGLAVHITEYLNDELPGAPVRIAGSVGVMRYDPWKFLADDIDLDYYDKRPVSAEAAARWRTAIDAFGRISQFRSPMGIARPEEPSVSGSQGELVEATWAIDGLPVIRTVDVEMKNVSGAVWHEGLRPGRRRDVGEGPWLPTAQLYLDVGSRIVDLILQARADDTVINKARAVYDVADTKSLFLKLKILKGELGPRGLEQAQDLAEAKLQPERFAVWQEVAAGTPLRNFV